MRYTDEGEILELCKWTVDLTSLPTFQQNAAGSNMAGFYTEFELGLELDSVEVRGILLYNGQEWGRSVFRFFLPSSTYPCNDSDEHGLLFRVIFDFLG